MAWRAKIPLRVVAHGSEPLGEDYFETALRRAVELRRARFQLDQTTDAYRLINSDGDGLSGLTIDRYADTLLCELYSLGMAQRLPKWLPLLHELAGTKFARVHVDHDLGSLEDFEAHVIKAAHRQNRRLQFFDRTSAGADHPVYSNCAESRYLKVLWARVV